MQVWLPGPLRWWSRASCWTRYGCDGAAGLTGMLLHSEMVRRREGGVSGEGDPVLGSDLDRTWTDLDGLGRTWTDLDGLGSWTSIGSDVPASPALTGRGLSRLTAIFR